MACELEQTIMTKIGLASNYRWYNGSGSCGHIREEAVKKLPVVAKEHGLNISPTWLKHCKTAIQADDMDGGNYSLTNTFVACSYAIADAIARNDGANGFETEPNWHFFRSKARQEWEELKAGRSLFEKVMSRRTI